jgi:serine/threonine protein kinase/tetratricopeptide (TPR) repeat protein
MAGRRLSHYEISDEISRGGMGIVYRARDTKLKREVAVKVLPPELVADPDRKRRFVQEAQAAAALSHSNIAVIYEIDESDGVDFIVMELIDGVELSDLLHEGPLPVERALEIGMDVAKGLATAHEHGVVHRDLKPANILIGKDDQAKIIDFGLAKLVEPLIPADNDVETATRPRTRDGQLLGTVAYMSPEQASGATVDHRSDIFSFGVVLYEILTGKHAFEGPTGVETLHAVLRDPAPRLADADSDLQQFLDKCLAKDPAERYQSMNDLLAGLLEVREGIEGGTRKVGVGGSASKRRWSLAAALGIVVATVLGWSLLSRDRPPPGVGASGRPAIAVMYFENLSGEEEVGWLSQGLPNMLITDLAQTPGLDVVTSERIHEILDEMGQENLETINKGLVPEIARRAGAGAVVVGSIFKLGDDVRIDVQVHDVGQGRVLSAESFQGQDVFPLVDELTGHIRTSLDLTDRPAGRPIAEVTTTSLEAYQLYSEGLEASRNSRFVDARKPLEEAVKIDPSFAMAYFELSYIVGRMGETGLSEQYRDRVLEHLDRLSARQQLLVQAEYLRLEGELEKSVDLLETLIARYPDEEEAYIGLARAYDALNRPERQLAIERGVQALPHAGRLRNLYGYYLLDAGRYQEAIREFETYVRLNPDEPNPYDSLAEAYLISGQPDKALEKYARALEFDPNFSHDGRAWAFAMLGRYDEALAERAEITNPEFGGTTLTFMDAFILSRVGRYREAEKRLQRGIEVSVSLENVGMQAAHELLSALISIEKESYPATLESASRAYELLPQVYMRLRTRTVFAEVAYLLAGAAEARAGNLETGRAHLDFQRELYDSGSPVESWFYHTLAGEIALATGDLAAAESHFSAGEPQFKVPFSLAGGSPAGLAANLFSNNLPFRDGLARVMTAQGDLPGAIEFYRKLNRRGISNKWTAMLEPRYVLELARLLNEAGDKEGALAEYERFLELWKNADEGLPELAEARAYVAR